MLKAWYEEGYSLRHIMTEALLRLDEHLSDQADNNVLEEVIGYTGMNFHPLALRQRAVRIYCFKGKDPLRVAHSHILKPWECRSLVDEDRVFALALWRLKEVLNFGI